MLWGKFERLGETYKFVVVAVLLAIACSLLYYFHVVLEKETTVSHFFYIPIVLACIWWKGKGLIVAVFSFACLILSHIILELGIGLYDEFVRGMMFVAIGLVVTVLSEHAARAKEGLQESEEIYRTLVENISLGIALVDTNYRIIMTNASHGYILKKPQSEFIGKYCFREFEKRDAVCSHCPGTRAMATGRPAEVETEGVRDDGSRFPVRIHAFPVNEADGTVKGFIEVVEDITERKQAEEALIQSEEEYKSVVENIGIGVSLISPKMEILTLNRQLREWFPEIDVSKRPICYRTFNKPPRENICSYCPTCKSLKDGQVHEAITGTPAGDKIVNYRIISSPIKDKDGRVIAAIEMVEDITERKKTEEALHEERDRAKKYLNIAGVMLLVVDADETVTLINRRGCEILGYGEDEIVGRNWFDTFTAEPIREEIRGVFKKLMAGELEPVKYYENPVITNSGEERLIAWHNTVLKDGQGNIIGTLSSAEDITERKRAEERLAEINECFLSFGADPVENIKSLTALCGKQLGGQCAIYNRLEDGQLCSIGQWNTPADYKPIDKSDGHICSDLISKATDEIWLVRHLSETTYARTDPNVAAYGLKTYIGKATKCCGKYVGSICVVYQKDFVPGEDDKRILGIVASAIGVEEERRLAEKALKASRDELEIRVRERTADLEKAVKKLRNEVSERKKAEEKLLTYQKRLRSSASELSLAEERLRRKIATDVHDHVGQNLAISKIKIESLIQSATSPKLAKALKEIRDLTAQAVESTRSLTFELSPPILYELGFEPAVQWLIRQVREQHGLSTEFTDDKRPKPLDDDIRVLLFQAVRELLVNVVKHAKASSVKVSAQKVGGQIRVSVEDDGVGFDVAQVHSQDHMTGGFGLFNIRERLDHIGGHLDIASRTGKGTRITLAAPITHEKEKSKGKQK